MSARKVRLLRLQIGYYRFESREVFKKAKVFVGKGIVGERLLKNSDEKDTKARRLCDINEIVLFAMETLHLNENRCEPFVCGGAEKIARIVDRDEEIDHLIKVSEEVFVDRGHYARKTEVVDGYGRKEFQRMPSKMMSVQVFEHKKINASVQVHC